MTGVPASAVFRALKRTETVPFGMRIARVYDILTGFDSWDSVFPVASKNVVSSWTGEDFLPRCRFARTVLADGGSVSDFVARTRCESSFGD